MIARYFQRAGFARITAVVVAVGLALWISPAIAGKKALTDKDLDDVSAGGGSTIISADGNVTNLDDSQFNLNFDVSNAQSGFRALTIQNVVGELQLLTNMNVLSANNNVNSTDQRNFSLQSWGGTLPIAGTGIIGTVSGVAAAPCSGGGSCVSTGGNANAPNTVTATAGDAAAAQGGVGGAGSPSAQVQANAAQSGSASGGSNTGAAGGAGGTGGAGGAGGAGGSGTTTGGTGGTGATGGGGGGGGAGGSGGAATSGSGGNATASSGNGGSGGNGGNAAAAGGGSAFVTANAGRGGSTGALTVSGSASTSPGVVAISPTASASGDLVITTTGGGTVNNTDNSQFNLTFTEPNAQSDLAALFISNVVGRSQMALNLNIASSQFTTVPFATNAISGDVTGTIKQVNTGLQFRGTPLIGATGVTTGVTLNITHQNQ